LGVFNTPVKQRNLGKTLSYIFLIAAVVFVAVHWAERILPEVFEHSTSPRGFLDFDCYADASRQVRAGESVYTSTDGTPQPLRPCVARDLPEYVYTPFLAVILAPFAGIDQCLLEILWLVINMVILCALVPLTITSLELPKSPMVFALAILLFGSLVATLETVTLGQINFVVLLMMMTAIISFNRGRVWWTSVAFATACVLKIVPLVFGVVLLRWSGSSQLKASLALVVFVVFSFVLARADSPADFLRVILAKSSDGLASTNNASLAAGLIRAISLSGSVVLAVNLVVASLVIGVSVWAVKATSMASNSWPLLASLLLALTLAISPVLEAHHLVMLYPALLYVFVGAFRSRPLRTSLLRLFAAAVITSLLNSRGLPIHDYVPDAFANLVTKPAWIGLWALIGWMCWEMRRRARAQSRRLTLP
jgi:alpha-1,2-mannosyltransferase